MAIVDQYINLSRHFDGIAESAFERRFSFHLVECQRVMPLVAVTGSFAMARCAAQIAACRDYIRSSLR